MWLLVPPSNPDMSQPSAFHPPLTSQFDMTQQHSASVPDEPVSLCITVLLDRLVEAHLSGARLVWPVGGTLAANRPGLYTLPLLYLQAVPPGCSRYSISIKKPLGLVLEQNKQTGVITIAEISPEGNAAKTGLVSVVSLCWE